MGSSCSPIRQNYKRHLAEKMLENMQLMSSDNYFLTIGKVTPWGSETGAAGSSYARPLPIPGDTDQTETEFWQNVVAAKRLTKDNISLVIPRFDWKMGSVFEGYRDTSYLFDTTYPAQFYVLVDETRVYKCIDNNYNTPSLFPPLHTDTDTRKLADGYRWKFMYQITEDQRKFLTKTIYDETTQTDTPYRRVIIQGYMPVSYVSYLLMNDDERVLQWNVQQTAINGEISFVGLNEKYKQYLTAINCIKPSNDNFISENYAAGYTGSIKIYSPYLVGVDSLYTDMILSVDSGSGEGQRRVVSSYVFSGAGNYGSVVLDSPLSLPLVAGTSKFSILPNIKIEGDGFARDSYINHFSEADITVKFGDAVTGGTSSCGENTFNQVYISSYELVDGGRDYTRAEFKHIKGLGFVVGATGSVDDTADIVISPPGGHGYNAVKEFGAATIMVVSDFDQSENGAMSVSNDYRQFGIIKNPLLKNKQVRIRLDSIGLSGSFPTGFTITQDTLGGISGKAYEPATGTVVAWRNTPLPIAQEGLSGVSVYGIPEIIVNNVVGNFVSTGIISSASASGAGSATFKFGVVEVDERIVAGTEGKELLRLKVLPTTKFDPVLGGMTAVFDIAGKDFQPGMMVCSIGNLESNIPNTRFTGIVRGWEPVLGSNATSVLYVENSAGTPRRLEKLIQTDYYLRATKASSLGLTANSLVLSPTSTLSNNTSVIPISSLPVGVAAGQKIIINPNFTAPSGVVVSLAANTSILTATQNQLSLSNGISIKLSSNGSASSLTVLQAANVFAISVGGAVGREVNNSGTAIITELAEIVRDSTKVYDQTLKLTVSTSLSNPFSAGSFSEDQIVRGKTGSTVEGTGVVIEWAAGTGATSGILRLCGVQGDFHAGNFVTYTDSRGVTASCIISQINHSQDLIHRSGEVTYIQNTQPIKRNIDQKEEIKILFHF